MKKSITFLLVIALVLVGFTFINPSWGDSGWDTSYGGGGYSGGYSSSDYSSHDYSSRDYSSSSYSSSDHSYSSSGSSRGSYSSSGETNILDGLGIILIFIILVLVIASDAKTVTEARANGKKKTYQYYQDMDINELQKLLPNETLESLKDMAVNKFVDIQNAWMNFDYEKLKMNCSDELYNTYYEQLEVLKAKKQQNVMSDFTLMDIRILSAEASEDYISIKVFLKIAFYDYVVDSKWNVVQGKDKCKVVNFYKLNFMKPKVEKEIKCPNCGGVLENVKGNKCPYCRAKIAIPTNSFVLSKKTNEMTLTQDI